MKAYLLLCFVALISCNSSPNSSSKNSNISDSTDKITESSIADSSQIKLEKPIKEDSSGVDQQADPIAFIREHVSRINTISMEMKYFEYMCDEMTKLNYFYEDGEIRKIAVDYGAVGDVASTEDYYYQNGKLIFIYKVHELLMPCNGCDQVKEYRLYINKDKVIRSLEDKENYRCTVCSFNTSSKAYKLLKAKTSEDMKAILCN